MINLLFVMLNITSINCVAIYVDQQIINKLRMPPSKLNTGKNRVTVARMVNGSKQYPSTLMMV